MGRILIVDDELAILQTLVQVLKRAGHQVWGESEAAKAVDMAEEADVDVVVTDIMMPGMSGLELLSHLRERVPGVEVVMITGGPDLETAVQALKEGAFDYLIKPIKNKDFVRAVNRAVDAKLLKDENRRLSEENRQHTEHLEQLVEERTAALSLELNERMEAEKKLKIAKEEAESANRAKGQFLANVSHELRTPMNAIMGMNQLLIDTPLTDRQREFCDTIKRSSEHLLGVIDDILDVSSIEAKGMQLQVVDFNLEHLVDEVIHTMGNLASDKGLSLGASFEKGVPIMLKGDPKRLRQVLINLVNNGLKFTSKGKVHIQIALDEMCGRTPILRFEVEDTGIGIAQEKISGIFHAFSQVDDSYTRQYGGVGLGLAISKQIVEMMKGRIGVESTTGKGSTFWFTAAFKVQSQWQERRIDIDSRTQTVSRSAAPDADDAGVLILVAEDDPPSRQVAALLLKKMGYQTETVTNGKEAFDAMCNRPYDLVLMDVQMPLMDGISVTQAFRDYASRVDNVNRHIPIIAMTAHAFSQDRERCLNAGMNDYISKPLEVEKFQKLIRKYVPGDENEPNRREFIERAGEEISIFDGRAFAMRLGIDDDLCRDLTLSFIEGITECVARLGQALEEGNMSESRRLAHQIQGAAANFEARQIGNAGKQLSEALKGKGLKAGRKRFETIESALQRLKEHVGRWIGNEDTPKSEPLGKKVLVVEDEPASRELLKAMLASEFRCFEAADGQEALEMFHQAWVDKDPFRLILLDIMMPRIDGQTVLKKVREFEETNGITTSQSAKIIMTTVLRDSNNILNAYSAQCEGYLIKPIDGEKLKLTVQALGF